jgi:hypothetical protein
MIMSDDLENIERLLEGYRPRGPREVLRERVLASARASRRWQWCQGIAAAVLIGLNLMQMAATWRQLPRVPQIDEARVQALAKEIRGIDPGVNETEARAMAERLAAGNSLPLLPEIHGNMDMLYRGGAVQ